MTTDNDEEIRLIGCPETHGFAFRHPKVFLTGASEEEAVVLVSLLESSGIQAERRYRSAAAVSRLYSGYSVTGCELFVEAEQLELAREIIKPPPGWDEAGE